jgi:hypothetical protein
MLSTIYVQVSRDPHISSLPNGLDFVYPKTQSSNRSGSKPNPRDLAAGRSSADGDGTGDQSGKG